MAAYIWTEFPVSGVANFESKARAAFELWRGNNENIDIEVYNARAGELTLLARLNLFAPITHTHGEGGIILTLFENQAALSPGNIDGEVAVFVDTAARASWDDGNSRWQMTSLGYWISTTDVNDDDVVVPGNWQLADTTSAAYTLKLPESPEYGDMVGFKDHKHNWSENNLTLDRNGKKIEGVEEDLICNVNYATVVLWFSGDTDGWLKR